MIRTIALLFALALAFPPAPTPFTATWIGTGQSRLVWSQSARACLVRQPQNGAAVAMGCYEGAGGRVVSFGVVGPLDAAYRPQAGDVYLLFTDDRVLRAPLLWRVWLPQA